MKIQVIKENTVSWYDMRGDKEPVATITTFTGTKLYRRLCKYFDREDIKLIALNQDETAVIEVPVKWIKITPPRYVSDNMRRLASERRRKKLAEEKWNNLFRQCSNNANEQ